MVSLDARLKDGYYQYLDLHRRYEMIDSAIIENFGGIYEYFDNEVELMASSHKRIVSPNFSTDLAYLSRDCRGVLFVEETINPTDKFDQLFKYRHVSPTSLRLINKADYVPSVDVFLVFPEAFRDAALGMYERLVEEDGDSRNREVSLWSYGNDKKALKKVGGDFSDYFPTCPSELKTKRIGTQRIFKKANEIYLLQFIAMKAFEAEYGTNGDNIEFNQEKLLKWLKPYGLVKEQKWREALRIGEKVGWISAFSPEQLTGTINYSKLNASSVVHSKDLMSDFFKAIEQSERDEKQSSLFDFL